MLWLLLRIKLYIITALEKTDMGCHIDNIFVGCIAYADDILLLSASSCLSICIRCQRFVSLRVRSLMLDLILINHVYLLLVDYKEQLANIHFSAGNITRIDNMKYLGINFVFSKRVKIDICPFSRKFYGSVNSVMAHSKFVNEDVKLRLLESFALPLLT